MLANSETMLWRLLDWTNNGIQFFPHQRVKLQIHERRSLECTLWGCIGIGGVRINMGINTRIQKWTWLSGHIFLVLFAENVCNNGPPGTMNAFRAHGWFLNVILHDKDLEYLEDRLIPGRELLTVQISKDVCEPCWPHPRKTSEPDRGRAHGPSLNQGEHQNRA